MGPNHPELLPSKFLIILKRDNTGKEFPRFRAGRLGMFGTLTKVACTVAPGENPFGLPSPTFKHGELNPDSRIDEHYSVLIRWIEVG